MISFNMETPQEMLKKIASSARARRLALNLSQQTLSDQSGVSYSVLKKFEQSGQISLNSLLKLALSLGSMEAFNQLFAQNKPEEYVSLDALMQEKVRKRGRR